ncbi:unnamed protein product [Zymoseptoria tritici ST99CH_1E4]|uniref:BTB domain-containing protein n=1 Tax=Zymoseptoria tritici ST99CH_1E4 TaxID=1276532 RepID=A0A2H1GT44_ZYMTR|nr:unnamed protein product [Zymoseptoria tritici ST99CH_1E4]
MERVEELASSFVGGEVILVELEDGGRFKVQSAILCNASDYFRKALHGGFKETSSKKLRLPGCTTESFQLILYWICNGDLPDFGPDQKKESADVAAGIPPMTDPIQVVLTKLWLCGDMLLMARLQNATMKRLRAIMENTIINAEALRLAFEFAALDSPLRRAFMGQVREDFFENTAYYSSAEMDRFGQIPGFLEAFFKNQDVWGEDSHWLMSDSAESPQKTRPTPLHFTTQTTNNFSRSEATRRTTSLKLFVVTSQHHDITPSHPRAICSQPAAKKAMEKVKELASLLQNDCLVKIELEDGGNFKLQRALLCDSSEYFRRALIGGFLESESKILHIPGCTTAIFELVLYWLFHVQLPTEDDFGHTPQVGQTTADCLGHMHLVQVKLVRLWIQADMLLMPALQNEAMRRLKFFVLKSFIGTEATRLAFSDTPSHSLLRKLFVDSYIYTEVPFTWCRKKGRARDFSVLEELGSIPGFFAGVMVALGPCDELKCDESMCCMYDHILPKIENYMVSEK